MFSVSVSVFFWFANSKIAYNTERKKNNLFGLTIAMISRLLNWNYIIRFFGICICNQDFSVAFFLFYFTVLNMCVCVIARKQMPIHSLGHHAFEVSTLEQPTVNTQTS